MIEVFKTDVNCREHANMLIAYIHKMFSHYTVNFDLDDCDRILRVQCKTDVIQSNCLIEILKDFGFKAEVLPDDQPVSEVFLSDLL